MGIIKKIVRFIARIINWIAVSAVRSVGFLSFAITILLILLLAAAYLADMHFADGYFFYYAVQYVMSVNIDWFYAIGHFTETYPAWSVLIVVAFFLGIAVIKIAGRKVWVRKRRRNIVANTANLAINIVMDLAVLTAAVILVFIGILATHIHSTTGLTLLQARENWEFASNAINEILNDMEDDPSFISGMTDEDREAFRSRINQLIDLQFGPKSPQEHYLRNRLNDAPATLDEMIRVIQKADPGQPAWVLMSPAQAAYHMLGPDGEYNLKFISADGRFEAVYNLKGDLLSENNDPVNMGTYNYANPLTEPNKHSTYDVLPYNRWGNALISRKPIAENAIEPIRAFERFESNPDAVARYSAYRDLID